APSDVVVRAGVSNARTALSSDAPQDRHVVGIRVHPGYHYSDPTGTDDAAVLTLESPLDLGGQTARAIALPTPSLQPEDGQTGTTTRPSRRASSPCRRSSTRRRRSRWARRCAARRALGRGTRRSRTASAAARRLGAAPARTGSGSATPDSALRARSTRRTRAG